MDSMIYLRSVTTKHPVGERDDYRFDEAGIHDTPYDAVDNVILMRDFLANPDAFLRQL